MAFSYFGRAEEPPDPERENYCKAADFAFFAVQFGYTKADYEALTGTEKAFILKAYEEKVVSDSNLLAGAVLNAISNAFRKKGKPFQKLWKKKPKRANREQQQATISEVLAADAKQGTAWIDAIYAANGRKRRKKVE